MEILLNNKNPRIPLYVEVLPNKQVLVALIEDFHDDPQILLVEEDDVIILSDDPEELHKHCTTDWVKTKLKAACASDDYVIGLIVKDTEVEGGLEIYFPSHFYIMKTPTAL